MNKKTLYLFTLLFLFSIFEAKSQFSKPISLGVGGGGTMLFGDFSNPKISYGVHADVDALITPFISAGINGQAGKLLGDEFGGRQLENKYITVNGNVKVRAGQFFNNTDNYSFYILSDNSLLSYLANFYVGAGVGVIFSNVAANRQVVNGQIVPKVSGNEHFTEMVIPLNVGIDFPMGHSIYGPKWAINLNYSYSFPTSDNLDGYVSPVSDVPDSYNYFSLGVKVALFNRN